MNPNSGMGDQDALTAALIRQRQLVPTAPPRRTATAVAPPQPTNYSIGKGTAAGDAWWDKLKYDPTIAAGANFGDQTNLDPRERKTNADARQIYLDSIRGNFANPGKLTGPNGSVGSQGGMIPVPGKPGYFRMTRQPPGNKSYNMVEAEYKIGKDGKSLERTTDWKPVALTSGTAATQRAVKIAAAAAAAGAGAVALGAGEGVGTVAGSGAFGEGAGSAIGGSSVGAGGAGVGAGTGTGAITGGSINQLTPAQIESAVGSPGYGASTAADAVVGPGVSGAGAYSPTVFDPNLMGPPEASVAPPPTANPSIGPPEPPTFDPHFNGPPEPGTTGIPPDMDPHLMGPPEPPTTGPLTDPGPLAPHPPNTPIEPLTPTPSLPPVNPVPPVNIPPISTPPINVKPPDTGGGLGDLLTSLLKNLSASKGGGGAGGGFRPTTAQQLQLAQSLRQPDNNITMINPNGPR